MDYVSKIQVPGGTTYNITGVIPVGAVASTSTSTVYTATISGITELKNGVCVWLTNGVVTSAANFTININGLGAKPVYRSNAATTRETTRFDKAYTIFLIYNETRVSGGCWDYVYGFDSNTTYTNMSQSEASAGTVTTGRVISAKVLSDTIEEKIEPLENNILWNTNQGVKNLLNIPDGTYTVAGLTVVVTGGELTFTSINATASAIIVGNINLKAGTYVLSDRAGGSKGYDVRLLVDGTNVTTDTDIATFTLSADKTAEIRLCSYATITNQKIKPMLCLKSLYDADSIYQPYALPNPELTASAIEVIDRGPKNLLNHTVYTRTVNDVTYTVNADRSIRIYSAGNNTQSLLYLVQNSTGIPAGNYVLSGCTGGSSTTYDLRVKVGTSTFYINYDGGTEFFYNGTDSFEASIVVRASQTVNLTMKPMICTKADWDVSHEYQPYRPSYQTLCDTNEYITGTGTELASNANLNDYNYTCKMYSPSAAVSATISNTPWTTSGFQLITVQFITTASYMQFLLPNTITGKWYRRRYGSGTWTDWVEFDAASYLIIGATAIASSTDLNNLKTPGIYTCASASVAGTLTHCPYKSSGFRCDIIQTSDTNCIRQIIQPNQMTTTGGNARYERSCVLSSSTWSSWYKFEGTVVT